MEPSDLPLVVPLEACATAMFRDFLTELDTMKQSLKEADEAVRRAKAKPPTPSTPDGGGPGGAKRDPKKVKKDAKPPLGGPNAPPATTAPLEPMSPLEIKKPEIAEKPPARDPWREAVGRIQQHEEKFTQSCEPNMRWMRARLDFLNSKASREFLSEEVMGEWIDEFSPPDFCIDAVQMTRKHTEKLGKQYGFVAPRGIHIVGKEAKVLEAEDVLSKKLAEHGAGGVGLELPFVCHDTVVLNASRKSQPPQVFEEEQPAATTITATRPKRKGESVGASKRTHLEEEEEDDDEAALGSMATKKKLSTSMKSAKLSTIRSVAPPITVEASSTNVVFSNAFPGKTYERTVTVWNRDSRGRRFKLRPSPSPLVSVRIVSPTNYDPQTPMVPGSTIQFLVTFTPVEAGEFHCVIELGHTREANRADPEENATSQWTFTPIKITGEAMPPTLVLADLLVASARPELRKDPEALNPPLDLGPTFAFSKKSISREITNIGCSGQFTLRPIEPFSVTPTSFALNSNETTKLTINFSPTQEGQWSAEIAVESTLLDGAVVTATETAKGHQPLTVRGSGVLPHVWIRDLGTATYDPPFEADPQIEITGVDQNHAAGISNLPVAILDDACVDFTSYKTLVVQNSSPLPIEFKWVRESEGGAEFVISPISGILPPCNATTFHLSVTPCKAERTSCLWKLMACDLPAIPVGFDDIPCLSRKKKQPTLAEFGASERDPFNIFDRKTPVDPTQITEKDDNGSSDVFCCALRLVADPVPLAVHLLPNIIESDVPSLVQQTCVREFLLINDCNADLEFEMDPIDQDTKISGGSFSLAVEKTPIVKDYKTMSINIPTRRVTTAREEVDLQFNPQHGTLPGNSSARIVMAYTLMKVGEHQLSIECRVSKVSPSPMLALRAIARGPTVHINDPVIDYGIVPRGGEGEARVQISNFSPVPLNFCMRDPKLPPDCKVNSEQAWFFFLPPYAPLPPGASTSVTLYIRGHVSGEVHEHIAVDVEDGITQWIDVRAFVQEPKATVTPSTLNYGIVDCGISTWKSVFLSNLSSIDMDYELFPVNVPSSLLLNFKNQTGRLHAGCQNQECAIEALFSGLTPSFALFALRSPQLSNPVPFEICCDEVKQLSIGVSVSVESTEEKKFAHVSQTPEGFVTALLWNIVSDAVGDGGVRFAPYCSAINHSCSMTDTAPYTTFKTLVRVKNFSGCFTRVQVAIDRFNPAVTEIVDDPDPNEKTQTATIAEMDKKKKPLALIPRGIGPNFTCKLHDGRGDAEALFAEDLKRARQLLVDGRGLAIEVTKSPPPPKSKPGDLPGGHEFPVELNISSNLPGTYRDSLHVSCDGLPSLDLPIDIAVHGHPILIDPLTPGLQVDEAAGRSRLLLQTLVSGKCSVKRKITFVSRCPRDLQVFATLAEPNTFINVTVTPNDNDETEPLSVSVVGNETDANSKAAAPECASISPTSFILPALQGGEIVLTCSPLSQAGMWRGQLTVSGVVADTPYNDKFYIDDFYWMYRHQCPSTRTLTPEALLGARNVSGGVKAVSKIQVRPPLVDRPDIVKDSNIVVCDEPHSERLVAQAEVSDSDSDNEITQQSAATSTEDAQYQLRMKQQKQLRAAQERERAALRAFLEARRHEERTHRSRYFLPFDVQILAKTVGATITLDPPEVLRLPLCRVNGGSDNTRSVHLLNEAPAAMEFRVEVAPATLFSIVTIRHKGYRPEAPVQSLIMSTRTAAATKAASTTQKGGTLHQTQQVHADPNVLLQLRPLDEIDVTVELQKFDSEPKKHQVSGEMKITFSNGVSQSLKLLATVHLPSLIPDPPSTAFRPPVEKSEGTRQPKYTRIIYLVNHTICDAGFRIYPKVDERLLPAEYQNLSKSARAVALRRSSNNGMPTFDSDRRIDDPSRFLIKPMSGVVEAASAGGAPTKLPLHISFEEYSSTKYQTTFIVEVDGGKGCEFVVTGDSKDTEL